MTRANKYEKRTNDNIYIYDRIYLITNMWEEEGKNVFKVFKFKLVKKPDKNLAFGVWKSVEL